MEIIENVEDFKKVIIISEIAGSALLKNEGSEEFEACRWIVNELINSMIAAAKERDWKKRKKEEELGNERN